MNSNRYLKVTLYEHDEISIDEIWGYSLDAIVNAKCDIESYLTNELDNISWPDGAMGAVFEVRNLEYHDAQIGTYPPPNVEIPGYWGCAIKLLGFDIESGDDWEFVPVENLAE